MHTFQNIRENRVDCEELVRRIVQLLDPIRETLGSQEMKDIDISLRKDLERFKKCVSYYTVIESGY